MIKLKLTFLGRPVNPIIFWSVNQLQNQWPPGDDAGPAGQNRTADQTLHDRTFTGTLKYWNG